MAIIAIKATMTVVPVTNTCPPPNGKFTATVSIVGNAGGVGGSYDVGVYAAQPWWKRDTLLDNSGANGVNAGKFKATHTFTLFCDNNCTVAGNLATSGLASVDVYAYADGGGNVTSQSGKTTLQCVPPELGCLIDPEGGTAVIAGGRLTIKYPARTVEKETRIRIQFGGAEPPLQYFPADVHEHVFRVSIGDEELTFPRGAEIAWRLSAELLSILTEAKGFLLSFDAASKSWRKHTHVVVEREVRFKMERGGLYGIAARAPAPPEWMTLG